MSEKLAIKSDKTKFWKRESDRAVSDIEPRPGETSKSSWAHVLTEDCAYGDFFAEGGRRANRQLQALAMLIFAERDHSALRSRITGLSINRSVLPTDTVVEEPDPHPVDGFDVTHRAIATSSERERGDLVSAIFRQQACDCWEYSREELIPLLQRLIAEDKIAVSFRAPARSLLERSTAGQ